MFIVYQMFHIYKKRLRIKDLYKDYDLEQCTITERKEGVSVLLIRLTLRYI